jgi:hypothetical protein
MTVIYQFFRNSVNLFMTFAYIYSYYLFPVPRRATHSNPAEHVLVTDGCFYGGKGMFRVAPPFDLKKLESIFRHKVFRMLLNKGKITEEMVVYTSKDGKAFRSLFLFSSRCSPLRRSRLFLECLHPSITNHEQEA